MAGRKRKSDSVSVSFENDEEKAVGATRSKQKTPTPSTRVRKGPRPSAEWIEVDSNDELDSVQPRLEGVLRGLNPNNVLPPTQTTIEGSSNHDTPSKAGQERAHSTRQSIRGKPEVNYDMKYHPMDEVTRPKRAAQRRSISTIPTKEENVVETDEESLPSSARDSGSEHDNADDGSSIEEVLSTQRAPDPRASRHSTRAEAQKLVNYSKKHHPQDYGLPGHEHKAKYMPMSNISQGLAETAASRRSNQSKTALDFPETGIDDVEHEVDHLQSRPRKTLRMLEDDREQVSKRKSNKLKAQKGKQGVTKTPVIPTMSSEGVNSMVEMAIKGSQVHLPDLEDDEIGTTNRKQRARPNASHSFNRASIEMMESKEVLASTGTTIPLDSLDEGPSEDLAKAGELPSTANQGFSDPQHDDEGFMMDEGFPSEIEGTPENATNFGQRSDFAPSPRISRTDGLTPDGTSAYPQLKTYGTQSQEAIDRVYSSSSEVGTKDTILESDRKGQPECSRQQSPRPSSHTLAGSSRKDTSSAISMSNDHHDMETHETGTPSAFEDEFLITEMKTDRPRCQSSNKQASPAAGYDLSASEHKIRNEQDPISETTESPEETIVEGSESVRASSLPPTDNPEFVVEGSETVPQLETPDSSAMSDKISRKSQAPFKSFDSAASHDTLHETIKQPLRDLTQVRNAHGTSGAKHGRTIPNSDPDSASDSENLQLERDDTSPDGPPLKTIGSSQHARSDKLVSSDPTVVGDGDTSSD